MDEQHISEYENMFEAFSSYKPDFCKLKTEGYFPFIPVFSVIALIIMIAGYFIPGIPGNCVMFLGAAFFFTGWIPRFGINETQKDRDSLLENIHKKGRLEWSMMEDYFISEYKKEHVREPKLFTAIELLAIGQFIAALSKTGNYAVNVLQILLMICALYRVFITLRKAFRPTRRDTIELILKETKTFLKKNPWKTDATQKPTDPPD